MILRKRIENLEQAVVGSQTSDPIVRFESAVTTLSVAERDRLIAHFEKGRDSLKCGRSNNLGDALTTDELEECKNLIATGFQRYQQQQAAPEPGETPPDVTMV